jgi:predicted  nucleic acid-binding Zn-ribbon protein
MDETRRATVEREAAAVLESQRALAEQLAVLNQRRAETGRTARAMRENVELATAAASAAGQARISDDASLLSDLRNARSLRKAIVMREVLGTPVALR